MFGNRGRKAMASTTTLSSKKLKNWMNVSRASLLRKSDGSDHEPDSLGVMLAQTK